MRAHRFVFTVAVAPLSFTAFFSFSACVGSEPEVAPVIGSADATTATDSMTTNESSVIATTPDSARGEDGGTSSDASLPSLEAGGPLAWFAGDDGLASDGGVTTWRDRTGHGHDLASFGTPPAIVSVSGKSSARFTTPAAPNVSCLSLSSLTVPAARSIYAVGMLTRWFGGGVAYDSTLLMVGAGAGTIALGTVVVAGPSPRWKSGNVQLGYNGSAIGDVDTQKIFAVRDDGLANLELTVSSNDQFKAATPAVGTYVGGAVTGAMQIGCSPAVGTRLQWDGTISEVILYDRRLTDQEHQATIDYLKTKWNVTFP